MDYPSMDQSAFQAPIGSRKGRSCVTGRPSQERQRGQVTIVEESPMSTSGRHFLQIPGPTNVPERILRAMARPTIDHRSAEFGRLGLEVLAGLKEVFKTSGKIVIFPASGTGAWEAALVNSFSPGDRVLMFETGHFATLWRAMAESLGLDVDFVPGDWRNGVDPQVVEAKLSDDLERRIKGVMVVH